MKKISLQFKKQINNASNISIINTSIERLVFQGLLWSLGTLALLYVLFLGNMVRNIVERRSAENTLRTLSSEVRNLELSYLSMSKDIDLNFSYSLGFKETESHFATRKALGLAPEGSINSPQNEL